MFCFVLSVVEVNAEGLISVIMVYFSNVVVSYTRG